MSRVLITRVGGSELNFSYYAINGAGNKSGVRKTFRNSESVKLINEVVLSLNGSRISENFFKGKITPPSSIRHLRNQASQL